MLSVTPEIVPLVVVNVTASPPAVSSLPLASTAWTVMVEVEDPSAVIDVEFAEIVDVEPEAMPGVNSTDASPEVIVFPLIVPLTSAVPVAVEVNVAV